ncbi:hypothetical protein GALMADRAFT_239581 [Galerina marginata CBS 339.88]|uniref:Uncharacterized protein n=1 Tax=Galerina marginata (strain CBS 339.88) TaxID=685588 RepID=A0A067TRG9_GALM3|nr:hypothetical protein GALMADRAFT_239581 [Galerina marginata CBS 339.88]
MLLTRVRCFGSSSVLRRPSPWFVDPVPHTFAQRPPPPHIQSNVVPAIPQNTPEVIKYLHAHLLQSPHLDLLQLVVSPAVLPAPGPPLPLRVPHGRRKRGGTYAGESIFEDSGGSLWDWVVVAQVKEGTENRGSIESVVRLVRKSLLKRDPPVPLAPKSRRTTGSDWVLIDGGDFAIHVVSRGAREKYFNQVEW